MNASAQGHTPPRRRETSIPIPGDALAATLAALADTPGGRAVAAWLDPGAPPSPSAWADARTAAWEQLHTGPWRDVAAVWRDAYGAACVLGGRALLLEEEEEGEEAGGSDGDDGRALAALDLADRALMMGGPAFHATAHALVAAAEARLAGEAAALIAGLPAAWPVPATPRALPPGSLACPPGARIPTPPSLPSLAAFAKDHLPSPTHPHGAPAVLAGLASAWPALTAWATPAGLAAAVGPHRTVPVEVGAHYLADGWGQRLQRFGEFVAGGMAAAGERAATPPPGGGGSAAAAPPLPLAYLAQHDLLAQVPGLRASILTPDYCALPASGLGGGGGGNLEAAEPAPPMTNAWLGPAGTVSPPHTDPHANLLVQVVGAKYVRLYAPECGTAGLAPPADGGGGEGGGEGGGPGAALLTNTSRVDLAALHPTPGAHGPAGLPFLDAILRSGDALFIPKGWWHYVQALEPSASVSFWWD